MKKTTHYVLTSLFVISISLLTTSSCHNHPKPVVQVIHDTVLKFIPHRAPDSAYLGPYEGTKEPFIIPVSPGSKDSLLVEDLQWGIDSGCHKYISRATGYLHQKDKNGKIIDQPITVIDDQNYDTLKTHFPAHRPLPAAVLPPSKKLPDSVHTAGAEEDTKTKWKKIRAAQLPYVYKKNDQVQCTIVARKVTTETSHDTIYLKTVVTAMVKFLHSNKPDVPVTMEEKEPIE